MKPSPFKIILPNRLGSALSVTIGMALIAAAGLTIAVNFNVEREESLQLRGQQQVATAALEGVLSHREFLLEQRALSSIDDLYRWNANYGEDYFGDSVVRWKIEPVIISEDGTLFHKKPFVTNPPPPHADTALQWKTDADVSLDTGLKITESGVEKNLMQSNEERYFYRISGEARIFNGEVAEDADWSSASVNQKTVSRVQGVRYIAIEKEPLFRWVIFYAQEGPKGDLELTHGPAVSLSGNVHSNGAIYTGAGTAVNDWSALINGTDGPTEIGSTNVDDKVSVVGVDGIFQLGKATAYGAFHGFPMSHAGVRPSISITNDYSTTGTYYEPQALLDARAKDSANLALKDITDGGDYINPYRITGDTLVPRSKDADGTDNRTLINGIELTGDKDSRSAGADFEWRANATNLYNGAAKSLLNGGSLKDIPGDFADRPLLLQKHVYVDPLKERHDLAVPLFFDGGQETAIPPQVSNNELSINAQVEVPGTYLEYAFGTENVKFQRLYGDSLANQAGFIGWKPVIVGDSNPPQLGDQAGLIIRERPLPAWPWSYDESSIVGPDSNDYLPYAYGKHQRPVYSPFTPLFVSAAPLRGEGAERPIVQSQTNTNTEAQNNWYQYQNGGGLRFKCQLYGGATNHSGNASDMDTWSLADINGYYRNNWRFIHLKQDFSGNSNWPNIAMSPQPEDSDNDLQESIYFSKQQFDYIQGQIKTVSIGDHRRLGEEEDNPIGIPNPAAIPQMGLMVRPMNSNRLTASAADGGNAVGASTQTNMSQRFLNGRDPFAAVLWNPGRGVATKRRGVASREVSRALHFTATDDPNSTSTASVPGSSFPVVGGDTATIGRLVFDNTDTAADPLIKEGVLTRDGPGEWMESSNDITTSITTGEESQTIELRLGPYTWKKRYTFYRDYTMRQRFHLLGGIGQFDPSDKNKRIVFYDQFAGVDSQRFQVDTDDGLFAAEKKGQTKPDSHQDVAFDNNALILDIFEHTPGTPWEYVTVAGQSVLRHMHEITIQEAHFRISEDKIKEVTGLGTNKHIAFYNQTGTVQSLINENASWFTNLGYTIVYSASEMGLSDADRDWEVSLSAYTLPDSLSNTKDSLEQSLRDWGNDIRYDWDADGNVDGVAFMVQRGYIHRENPWISQKGIWYEERKPQFLQVTTRDGRWSFASGRVFAPGIDSFFCARY